MTASPTDCATASNASSTSSNTSDTSPRATTDQPSTPPPPFTPPALRCPAGLHRHVAAIDVVRGAADVAGPIRTQPDHHLGDLLRVAHAAHRDLRDDLLAAAAHRVLGHPGFDEAGAHRVDPDLL